MAGIKHKTRVAGTKINTSAVWGEDHEIEGGAIGTAEIADNAITSAKIAADTVIAADIAAGGVNTEELADNAVTNAKMADNAVNTAELVNNAVTTAKIADNQVTTAKMNFDNEFTNIGCLEKYCINDGTTFPVHECLGPRGYYYNGRTYIGYQGLGLDPYATFYDHNKQVWATPVKIGDTALTDDSHGSVAIIVDDNGYIHAFYGTHSWTPGYIKHSRSTNPEDITSWTLKPNIGTNPTYPYLTKSSDGTLYLFYRESVTASHTRIMLTKSTDNGENWSAPTTTIDFGTGYSPYQINLELETATPSKIHVAWLIYNYSTLLRHNVYHAYMRLDTEHLYSMDGTDLGTSIDQTEGDTKCKVFDSGASPNQTIGPKVRVDSAGTPYVLWGHDDGTNHYQKSSKWTGAAWSSPTSIVDARYWTSGRDFIVTAVNTITAWLSAMPIDGFYVLDEYKTTDGGSTWARVRRIKTWLDEGTVDNVRVYPQIVPNYQNDLKVLFAHAEELNFDQFYEMYAWGDNGYVYRRHKW